MPILPLVAEFPVMSLVRTPLILLVLGSLGLVYLGMVIQSTYSPRQVRSLSLGLSEQISKPSTPDLEKTAPDQLIWPSHDCNCNDKLETIKVVDCKPLQPCQPCSPCVPSSSSSTTTTSLADNIQKQQHQQPQLSAPPSTFTTTPSNNSSQGHIAGDYTLSQEAATRRMYFPEGHTWDASYSLDPRLQAVYTREAQAFIHAHQFPPASECRSPTTRFYVHNTDNTMGLGSQIHIATLFLAWAIDHGLIFVWGSGAGKTYASPDVCGPAPLGLYGAKRNALPEDTKAHPGLPPPPPYNASDPEEKYRGFLCFFQAPSSCDLRDVAAVEAAMEANISASESVAVSEGEGKGEKGKDKPPTLAGTFLSRGGLRLPWVVRDPGPWMDKAGEAGHWMGAQPPTALSELWKSAHPGWRLEIPDKGARKYWWRGQGAAYLMRLNPSTLAALRDLRGREEVLEAVVGGRPLLQEAKGDGGGSGISAAASIARWPTPQQEQARQSLLEDVLGRVVHNRRGHDSSGNGDGASQLYYTPSTSPGDIRTALNTTAFISGDGASLYRGVATFPLPPGSVSAHIRHGDKHREMTLVKLPVFLRAASALADAGTLGYSRKALFVSTEDPGVVADLITSGQGSWEEALEVGIEGGGGKKKEGESGGGGGDGEGRVRRGGVGIKNIINAPASYPLGKGGPTDPELIAPTRARWSLLFTPHPMMPRENSNGPQQVKAFKTMYTAGELTLRWWLQLLMALECDAWVGTRGSNWNRLIDELRCIWLPKCTAVYVEVGEDKDCLDYGW